MGTGAARTTKARWSSSTTDPCGCKSTPLIVVDARRPTTRPFAVRGGMNLREETLTTARRCGGARRLLISIGWTAFPPRSVHSSLVSLSRVAAATTATIQSEPSRARTAKTCVTSGRIATVANSNPPSARIIVTSSRPASAKTVWTFTSRRLTVKWKASIAPICLGPPAKPNMTPSTSAKTHSNPAGHLKRLRGADYAQALR